MQDGKVVGIVALGDMAQRKTCDMEAAKALTDISSNVRKEVEKQRCCDKYAQYCCFHRYVFFLFVQRDAFLKPHFFWAEKTGFCIPKETAYV